jgi:hypothetical protein
VPSTFWLQNPTNPQAGLVTGAYLIRRIGAGVAPTDRPTVTDLAGALRTELSKDQF